MKKKLALLGLGLIGVLWAQNQVGISTGGSTTNYTLTQIQKITFLGANTVIYFVGGSSSSFASVGTKWTFGNGSNAISSSLSSVNSSSSVAVSSSLLSSSSSLGSSAGVSSSLQLSSSSGSVVVNQATQDGFKYQIHSNLLSVSTDLSSQFRLLRMNGQVYSESKPSQKEWSVTLGSENLILQVQNTNSFKNYLVQVQK